MCWSVLCCAACPANVSVTNDEGKCSANVTYVEPVGSHVCGGATTTRTGGIGSGSNFAVGVHEEMYTVTAVGAGETSCTFGIDVRDSEAPIDDMEVPLLQCPSDIVRVSDSNQCGTVVTYEEPVGIDNCGSASTSRVAGGASGSVFGVGNTTVRYRAIDESGNTNECTFVVSVVDETAPVLSCRDNITTAALTSSLCGATVFLGTVTGSDQCGGVTVVRTSSGDGLTFPVGVSTEHYVGTDVNGNSATCTFTVTVRDETTPDNHV